MDIALTLSLILLLALGCQWLAWRMQLPAILFLLISGLVLGPVSGFLQPDPMFQDLLMPLVSLSVAIILFEGSLSLKLAEVRELGTVVQRMVTLGALVLWIGVAFATWLIFGFSPLICALFGALMVVTGPTVIVPMLRSVRPTRKVANVLRWEGIIIDPIGALFAVVTYEFIVAFSHETGALQHSLIVFGETIITGLIVGIIGGWLLGYVIRHHFLPEYLHNMATLALLLVVFSLSNVIHHESGLLAVTVMGMYLANNKDLNIENILNFKEHLSLLLISLLFIVLAARIEFSQFVTLGWQPVLILLFIQFVGRPLKVFLCTLGADFSWQEKTLLSWIAPRGIVAAAISAIFAERLLEMGYEEAALLVPLTFWIIIGTVVLQSATAKPLASMLGVMEPARSGFLIVGANMAAREMAKVIKEAGFRAVVTDTSWDNIREARMAGLECYFGNPVSEHADKYLDLSGLGNLLTISPYRDVNAVAAVHFRSLFGERKIFGLSQQADTNGKFQMTENYLGNRLFSTDMTYSKLASLVSKGYHLRSSTLTESYDWAAWQEKHAGETPMFYMNGDKRLRPIVAGSDFAPKADWRIFAFSPPGDFATQTEAVAT